MLVHKDIKSHWGQQAPSSDHPQNQHRKMNTELYKNLPMFTSRPTSDTEAQ